MRDLLVTLLVFGSLPYVFKKPWFGMVLWVWISVMNPHSQGWGFARSFPFAAVIAATCMASIVMSKERFRVPVTPVSTVFVLFIFWMCVSSLFAIHLDQVGTQWVKVMKITGMTLVMFMLVRERRHIEWMIWTIVVSIGYYGVKGGLFTLRSGGNYRVWGPAGTFIDDNNAFALALIMVIPLMYYLLSLLKNRYGRYAMMGAMLLCTLASLGSYSRGAAVAMAAMILFFWAKSNNRVVIGVLLVCVMPVLVLSMPSQWHERIDTIKTYEEDGSAMGRINAWRMATNLALDRPLVGGGFEIYDPGVFLRYAPVPEDVHAAHSIYFQILGEHGFVGLLLYLTLGALSWREGSRVVRLARTLPQLAWASNLARMLQVSLLGFAVGGAFLSLAYFDVPYYLMVALAATRAIAERESRAAIAAENAKLLGDAAADTLPLPESSPMTTPASAQSSPLPAAARAGGPAFALFRKTRS
ncbi:putative O-glycosylation ligase, exosortase A system-associated [Janthinobacterium sp. BJB412]|nr:putative O-glycosylation ligase, exosortase A system-associated [Janthinobacterium sp. BJB412]